MGTFTTNTGVTLTYRRLALGTSDLIKSRVLIENEASRPQPPVQIVETISGPQEIVNETHPDHIAAVAAWDKRMDKEARLRMVRLVTDYGLEPTPIDQAAVDRYREAMKAVGVELEDSDKDLYFWRIACPDQSDVNALMSAIVGIGALEEAIRRGRQAFRSAVSGSVDMEPAPANGQGPIRHTPALS